MRRRLVGLWSLTLLVGVIFLPGAASASGSGYSHAIIHNFCGRPYYTWTTHFKVSVTAGAATRANMLTIDAVGQTEYTMARHPHWINSHSFSQAVLAFARDGTAHTLAAGRQWTGGGIEQRGRIVMTLRAWHYSTLLWSQRVVSTTCPY
jgi:hypothetical protein